MDNVAFMRRSSFVPHGLIKTLAEIVLEGGIEF
jgi:ribosomal protein L18